MPDEDPAWEAYRRDLGDRLRDARLAAGLTQEALAHQAGVSRTLVQRTERAYGEVPGLRALWRLGEAVGVDARDLLPDVRQQSRGLPRDGRA